MTLPGWAKSTTTSNHPSTPDQLTSTVCLVCIHQSSSVHTTHVTSGWLNFESVQQFILIPTGFYHLVHMQILSVSSKKQIWMYCIHMGQRCIIIYSLHS